MGLWPAVLLAREGCAVTVLEANRASIGASWAAAGMLAPASEAGHHAASPGALDAFRVYSLGLWQDWAAHFEKNVQDINWRPCGVLHTAFEAASKVHLESCFEAAKRLDLSPSWLTRNEAVRREPNLNPALHSALMIGAEASVNPRLVLIALQKMLIAAGGKIINNHKVASVDPVNSSLDVMCANGETFNAERLIIAAGFQCGAISGLDELTSALRPVKGQMLLLDTPQNPLQAVIRNQHCYLVPRGNGQTVIGATSEPGRDDVLTDEETLNQLHGKATKTVAVLSEATRLSGWAGVRPQSKDGLPLIGPLGMAGVYINGGHYRNGVLMAPASAKMLCDMVLERQTGPFNDAFDPGRFASC